MRPLDKPLLLEIYKKMVSVRTFEETAADLFLKGQIPGFLHVYVGEEAVAAGVMAHLTDREKEIIPSPAISSRMREHRELLNCLSSSVGSGRMSLGIVSKCV